MRAGAEIRELASSSVRFTQCTQILKIAACISGVRNNIKDK